MTGPASPRTTASARRSSAAQMRRRPVAARREHAAAVGAEAHRVDGARVAAEHREPGARRGVPDARGPVRPLAVTRQPAVRAEGRSRERRPCARAASSAARPSPRPRSGRCRSSLRSRSAVPVLGRSGRPRRVPCLPLEGADLATGDSVEQPHRAVAVRGRDSRAVGAPGRLGRAVGRREAGELRAGRRVPDARGPVVARRDDAPAVGAELRAAAAPLWPRSVATFAPVAVDQTIARRRRIRSRRRARVRADRDHVPLGDLPGKRLHSSSAGACVPELDRAADRDEALAAPARTRTRL